MSDLNDEYDMVSKGKLKLKTDSKIKKKKNKKDKHHKEKLNKSIDQQQLQNNGNSNNNNNNNDDTKNIDYQQFKMTKAERAFKKMQQKMQEKRIMEKASMTHKQRVEKFNEHLDGLTEHFDIPKVSWTK